jgi:Flp pilus assembly protein TadD
LQTALRRRPGDLDLLMMLGGSYPTNRKEVADETVRWYQAAVAVAPANAAAHINLGAALQDRGQVDEAIAWYLKAIALDPKNARAHNNLGNALRHKGQVEEASACFRKVIELDPGNALAHCSLGDALRCKGQLDEAITCFRKAIELDPKYANAHIGLGTALKDRGQLDEASACFHMALELDPRHALVRDNLDLAQRLAAVQGKLPALLKGDYQPKTNDERLALAQLCKTKRLPRTSAGLYAIAFAADPKSADDLKAAHRYHAACSTALAAAGRGEDARKLDDQERARMRRQALDWLRADLASRTRQVEGGQPADRAAVQEALRQWQEDNDLAGLRNKAALEKLSAEEQKAFTQLWIEVAELRKKVEEAGRKEGA